MFTHLPHPRGSVLYAIYTPAPRTGRTSKHIKILTNWVDIIGSLNSRATVLFVCIEQLYLIISTQHLSSTFFIYFEDQFFELQLYNRSNLSNIFIKTCFFWVVNTFFKLFKSFEVLKFKTFTVSSILKKHVSMLNFKRTLSELIEHLQFIIRFKPCQELF